MAHGKKPGTITKILAPSPPCPSPGLTQQSQEEQQGLVREASEKPLCTLKNDNNDQLIRSVPTSHYYMSCDPSPEDMEDTCSEYDNVGSDVEQDYDEVLHLNKEGVVDTRYYKQYSPEDGGYIKHAVGDNINENSSAVDQFAPRPRDEAEREVGKGHENRFFFSDGDEIEEVLDGAKFIEDLEETANSVQRKTSLYQDNGNERIRKGDAEREREDDTRVTRNHNIPAASKKCESSYMGAKEKQRQGKGRGRKVTGDDIEPIVAGIKGSRSGSSKPHPPPPPRHSHAQPPADTQKAPPRKETSPVPRPSPSSPDSQESEPRVIKPSLAPIHTPEQQREPIEERQRWTEKPQQVVNANRADLCQISFPVVLCLFLYNPPSLSMFYNEGLLFCCIVPGPCEPEDLIDGIIFAANYLGCTQVLSDKNPSKSVRMSQAHEAVSRIKVIYAAAYYEESQMITEVDLFISTKAVKVLNADTQETMMDSALRTISYIADIGSIVVLMARRRMSQASSEDFSESPDSASEGKSQYRMICYVFESEDAQLIAQSIGQAFSVAYREFLRANGINPTDLSQKQYSDIINSQEMYHDDLVHFSNSDNCKELNVEKQKGEILGVVIVESGWGSILPTVILASMLNSGPAARSGKLSVGDQIMSINDTSLVGLPLATCQGIIKGLKNQVKVKLSIVSCPPVTTVLIKRPDLKFQLGFSVQNGIICSLMRGGIAERGGVRVGHRIIEINGQSVVAMAHEKIVQTLSVSVGEINMKTMPAVMFRLLTGQETPVYI
uniref:Amyloid-beta A4 precursor protein-binding family A member 3 n=1 Tax=Cyclopterus lumpus TaxID=8103 RepID=A0A8C2XF49_CYCLU